jgi:hypothetical protein
MCVGPAQEASGLLVDPGDNEASFWINAFCKSHLSSCLQPVLLGVHKVCRPVLNTDPGPDPCVIAVLSDFEPTAYRVRFVAW